MRDVEIPKWLEGLPLAPEFRPTDTEFADPIAYISKIEKEASAFGICKVIPPLPKPPRKYVLHNLNKSLSKSPELGLDGHVGSSVKTDNGGGGENDDGMVSAVFTTRSQELGQSGKRVKAVVGSQPIRAQKQVWQSGEIYTLEQFEAKSKNFTKSQLGMVKEVSSLAIETMFWKATSEKPIYVEYANDVPGSGFGEPEGSFRNFHRRRRRRKRGTFDRNNQEKSGSKNGQVDNTSANLYGNSEGKDPNGNLQKETSCTSTCFPSDHSANISRHQCSNSGNDMQGTAGWKLSNSPWNLQVIARSPGSLTRFMPDDIPGVTSPMVYIGMLFSWFAWHVEDHELHSLNYLHIGSPKTWYAVPGDYAFAFEEVIRFHAYGGSTARLDALTFLGEKTTLVSPEVIVASGIPCCRLVQNPGEFVVTFPRAYHVGFSHGFNCGEAANFGTPKWLTVAKEAAVRRAAMNYLPMLSHQQLLYLLTMSFISRLPRSLLPGARSSRLRDRQKEERELSVKTAFIKDILKENHLLTVLLQKDPSYHVVLWNLDLLPSSSKETQFVSNVDTLASTSRENNHSDNHNSQDLYTQMSLYMDSVNDSYADDADDLLCDYQVDSGTLPCVACGILGFPFMAVVQPSEQASRNLMVDNPDMIMQSGVSKSLESQSLGVNGRSKGSAADIGKPNEKNLVHQPNEASLSAELSQSTDLPLKVQCPVIDHSSSPEHASVSSTVQPERGWNLSDGCLRPRIFCLEHAIQTVNLLHSKGGANVLGICHSDFQKIKAHAAIVAEEVCSPFTYKEIPLDDASQGDLYLIDYATDDQEKDESAQDWTSKLSISLQHCVKMRKSFPSQNVEHALALDALFSDTTLGVNALKWKFRKLRSKRNLNLPSVSKPSVSIQIEKVEPGGMSDGAMTRKEDKVIIQYYRKKYKSKPCGNKGVIEMSADFDELPSEELPAADCGVPSKMTTDVAEKIIAGVEDAVNCASGLSSSVSIRMTKLQREDQVGLSAENLYENPFPSQVCNSVIAFTLVAESIRAQTETRTSNEVVEMNKELESPCHDSQELRKIQVAEGTADVRDTVNSGNSVGAPEAYVYSTDSRAMRVTNIDSQTTERASRASDVIRTDESGRKCNIQVDGVVAIKEPSDPLNSCIDADDSSGEKCNKHIESTVADECRTSGGLYSYSTLNSEVQQQMRTENRDVQELSISTSVPLTTEVPGDTNDHNKQLHSGTQSFSFTENRVLDDNDCNVVQSPSAANTRSKRKREVDMLSEDHCPSVFIRSPCECLRSRAKRNAPGDLSDCKRSVKDKTAARKVSKGLDGPARHGNKKEQLERGRHKCDIEGCRMNFPTKAELSLHKCNRCHVEGCGKKFSSHKYAILHQRVHDDDRPLKCPWKGCKMTFKWAWARTEHLRVHTGERPYKCKVDGCGLTFRFVSDFSRHRRKTGHHIN